MKAWLTRGGADEAAGKSGRPDLLPPRFRQQRKTRHTLVCWAVINLALSAILIASFSAVWATAKRIATDEAQRIEAARPLLRLRDEIRQLEQDLAKHRKACTLVESARPDDSLLQVVAAVTAASQTDDHRLLVDAIGVTLPLEAVGDKATPPDAPDAGLLIDGSVQDKDTLDRWIERLHTSDRLRSIELRQAGRRLLRQSIRVTATPLSTRLLP
jgi:hypothetical protein